MNELNGKFYIFQVVEKNDSYLPVLEDVLDRVKEDATDSLAAQEAKKAAEEYLKELRDGAAWDELAKEKQLTPEETDFFARRGSIPKIGYEQSMLATAFKLNENNRYPDNVFENNKGTYVIRWEGYKGIDEKDYENEKEDSRRSLTLIKQRRAFQNWLESLREKAEIEIEPSITEE